MGTAGVGLFKSTIKTIYGNKFDWFELGNNYPNPFNSETKIPITIYSPGEISIVIYNSLGQKIQDLFTGFLDVGYHEITWHLNGKNSSTISTGVYFYQIKKSNSPLKYGKALYIK